MERCLGYRASGKKKTEKLIECDIIYVFFKKKEQPVCDFKFIEHV